MRKRFSVTIGLVAAIFASVWATTGGASATANHQTAVKTPTRFSTAPFKGGSALGVSGVLKVGKDRRVINKSGAQSETAVAIDPLDSKHIVAASNDLSNFSTFNNVVESFDRGNTWANAGLTINAFCYDPWLDFNANGDLFFSYECSDQRIAYRKAGTTNWVASNSLPAGSFPDRDMVVTDDWAGSPFKGHVYIGYDDNGSSNAAHLMLSNDGFGGWVESPKFNDGNPTIGVNASVAPDGTIYAVWEDYTGKKIWVDKSTDGGHTWGTDHVVTNYRIATGSFFVCIPPQPDRCVVPMPFSTTDSTGRLYVVYPDKDPVGADWNTYVRTSTDGGVTWSAEVKVNDDAGGAYQFFPNIAVSPNNTVAVSFYDTRNDNALDHKTDRYMSFSTDGGVTWTANTKVTSAMSDESGAGDANDYGDYEGIAASPLNTFHMVWTDSRTGLMAEDVMGAAAKL